MKQILFTLDQTELITIHLNERLKSYQEEINICCSKSKKFFNKEINIIEKVISKVTFGVYASYSPKQKLKITSIINDFLYSYRGKEEKLLNLSLAEFTELTEDEKENLQLLDLCYEILEKIGYKKSKFRFANVFEKIDKLKKSQKICLSITKDNQVYKMAFVNNREVLEWRLNQNMNIFENVFSAMSITQVKSFQSSYMHCFSKRKAKEIIKSCDPINFSEDTLKFTKYLLS